MKSQLRDEAVRVNKMAFLPKLYTKITEENVEFSTSRETQRQLRYFLSLLSEMFVFYGVILFYTKLFVHVDITLA